MSRRGLWPAWEALRPTHLAVLLAALSSTLGCWPTRGRWRGPRSPEGALRAAEEYSDWVDAAHRLEAVEHATRCTPDEGRAVLRRLLDDPDPVVRRAAAEALLGALALRAEVAERHGYTDVLAAERDARELLATIRRADLPAQYEATQQLIALGWKATIAVSSGVRDSNKTVMLSAWYASQEIEAARRNIPPRWAEELAAQLKTEKVSFDFRDTPLSQAVKHLSEQTGVPIRVVGLEDAPDEEPRITLRVVAMTLESALGWLTKLVGWQSDLWGRAIRIHPKESADGTTTLLIDVRDLEAAGIRPDWRSVLASQVPRLSTSLWGRHGICGLGPGFRNRRGMLLMDFWVSKPDWGARAEADAIAAYLNRLRALVRLDPERVRELVEADARTEQDEGF